MREHYKNTVKLRARGKVGVPELIYVYFVRFTDICIFWKYIFSSLIAWEQDYQSSTRTLVKTEIMSLNFLGIL